MFGRVRRAATNIADEQPVAAAVMHSFNPATVASAASLALGAGGAASGGTLARLPDGSTKSALGEALTQITEWGERERHRYLALPSRVLIVVTASGVLVSEWSGFGRPALLDRWAANSFSAEQVAYNGQLAVRVVLRTNLVAVLAGSRNPLRRRIRHTIHAVVALGS